jgi:hypothetical protein
MEFIEWNVFNQIGQADIYPHITEIGLQSSIEAIELRLLLRRGFRHIYSIYTAIFVHDGQSGGVYRKACTGPDYSRRCAD